jgi:predicted 3-demethylubiquinone-9 3-methyltransferase (glyoxalase superfamily)
MNKIVIPNEGFNDKVFRASIRPYISIDIIDKQEKPKTLPSSIYCLEDGSKVSKTENDQFQYFCFTNMGNGNAFRFTLTNLYRYVKDKNDEDALPSYYRIVNNRVILPVCNVLPVIKDDLNRAVTANEFQHEKAVIFCIDIGENQNSEIMSEFYDINNNKYTQTFKRIIGEENSNEKVVKDYIRYYAEPPELKH